MLTYIYIKYTWNKVVKKIFQENLVFKIPALYTVIKPVLCKYIAQFVLE